MTEVTQERRTPDRVLTDFVNEVTEVAHAVMASSDGLPLATSPALPGQQENLAAASAALTSMATGVAYQFEAGSVHAIVVTMTRGQLLLIPVNNNSIAVQVRPKVEISALVKRIRLMTSHLAEDIFQAG